jgi:ribosomal protein L16/L10AE
LLTTDHLDVLWRVVRRKVRRFGINFRRSSLAISLQLNATKTYTKRPKGGRMGSGKSPMHRRMVPVYNGQVILSCNEIRLFPFNTLLELKNAIKKLPVKCVVEVNKHSH